MYRPHRVRSVLTTSVKILPYRPPARLIRAKSYDCSRVIWNKISICEFFKYCKLHSPYELMQCCSVTSALLTIVKTRTTVVSYFGDVTAANFSQKIYASVIQNNTHKLQGSWSSWVSLKFTKQTTECVNSFRTCEISIYKYAKKKPSVNRGENQKPKTKNLHTTRQQHV